MLNQKLSQKLLQKLSPQQIQLMKLLQVPTVQLEQRIKEELEANPALDEGPEPDENEYQEGEPDTGDDLLTLEKDEDGRNEIDDDLDLSDYYDEDEVANYKLKSDNYSSDDEEKTIPIAVESSYHEHLVDQLGMLDLDERTLKVAEQIIGSIDDDGYLRRDLDSVVDDLAFGQNIFTSVEELEGLLEQIQTFDPPGTGGRDLQECLMIQLNRLDADEPAVQRAKLIISEYFELFTKKHYEKLERSLDVSQEELKEALDTILKLNPKPGSGFSGSGKGQQYVTPDYFINNNNGELHLSLNARNAPELRVSQNFKDMLHDYDKSKTKSKEQKEAVMFIKQKIDSAKWFIDAIQQRQHTLLSTMQTIMQYQYDFFLTGDETELKPMILKDIAERTGLDISTVSRVANSKYVQTEFGTFSLKYFFSESLQTDSGEEVSTREVKSILSDLIGKENKRKPLSDQKLMEHLNEKGYNIARRTVAKYREQLNIPVARLRKEM